MECGSGDLSDWNNECLESEGKIKERAGFKVNTKEKAGQENFGTDNCCLLWQKFRCSSGTLSGDSSGERPLSRGQAWWMKIHAERAYFQTGGKYLRVIWTRTSHGNNTRLGPSLTWDETGLMMRYSAGQGGHQHGNSLGGKHIT